MNTNTEARDGRIARAFHRGEPTADTPANWRRRHRVRSGIAAVTSVAMGLGGLAASMGNGSDGGGASASGGNSSGSGSISILGYPVPANFDSAFTAAGKVCPDEGYTESIAVSQAYTESSDGRDEGPVTADNGTTHEGAGMFDPNSSLWIENSQNVKIWTPNGVVKVTQVDIWSPDAVVVMADVECGYIKQYGWPVGTALNAFFAGPGNPGAGGSYGQTIIDNAQTVKYSGGENDSGHASGESSHTSGHSQGIPKGPEPFSGETANEITFGQDGPDQIAFTNWSRNQWIFRGVIFTLHDGKDSETVDGEKVVINFKKHPPTMDVE